MKTLFFAVLCFASISLVTRPLSGQAIFAANETTRIQAGAGGTYLNTDYSSTGNKGVSFWADYDFHKFLGLEAEGHLGGIISPSDIGENTYLIGPRILYRKRHLTAYGKALVGHGTITDQLRNHSSGYNLYAFGGGVEYKVSRRLNLRAVDFEMQKWPNFQPNSLSPTVITVGVSYVIR